MSRMSGQQLEFIRKRLIAHYGNWCWVCTLSGNQNPLDVDHWDNNSSNNDWHNLHILCCSCNTMKDHPQRKELGEELINARARIYEHGQSRAQSLELEISQERKPMFYRYLFRRVLNEGEVKYDELLDAGARIANISQDALMRRWLPAAYSQEGLYERTLSNMTIERVIKFKERWETARAGIQLKEQAKEWKKK